MVKKVARRRKRKEEIKVSKPMVEVKCAYCKGTGKDPWGLMSVLAVCQVCKGKGTVQIEEPFEKCPVCHGTGVQYNTRLTCLACGGKGVLTMVKEGEVCPVCGGTGRDGFGLYCLKCKGTGKVKA